MFFAGYCSGRRMSKVLLEHDDPFAYIGTLNLSAEHGQLATLHLLMQHSADLNEAFSG